MSLYYNKGMSKIITFRVNDMEQKVLDRIINKYNEGKEKPLSVSDTIKSILSEYAPKRAGVEIPHRLVSKDSIAEFLGIGKLDKRWVTFMDKIEKTYYE